MPTVRPHLGARVRVNDAGGLWHIWDQGTQRGWWWLAPADDTATAALADARAEAESGLHDRPRRSGAVMVRTRDLRAA